MRTRLYTAAIAASLVAAFAPSSYAATVSLSESATTGPGSVTAITSSFTGTYDPTTTGSISGVQLAPFAGTPNASDPYSALGNSAAHPDGTATFNYATGLTSWSFIWGSPDAHNSIVVLGTGGIDQTYTGSSLGVPLGSGAYLVTITASGGLIDSVELENGSSPAFEFDSVTATPLPAALPLFASALGIGGIFLRLRKKKAAKSQVAFA